MRDIQDEPERPLRRATIGKLVLVAVGTAAGLLLAEGIMAVCGLPRFHKAHSAPEQFQFLPRAIEGIPFYVNVPATDIVFAYDSNPRRYFDDGNKVAHSTNSAGFRGPEFSLEKPEGCVRLMFLGDSFTFGEGVHNADTYSELTIAALRKQPVNEGLQIEGVNLGVGGYNTTQSYHMLTSMSGLLSPDIVVLGYVLNDSEPPLFQVNSATGQVERTYRPVERWEGSGEKTPPDSLLFAPRISKLVWKYFDTRDRTAQTVSYYRSLFDESNPGWQASRRDLRRIAEFCDSIEVPCCVLLFPLLHNLEEYPYRDIHTKLRHEVLSLDMMFVDLLTALNGKSEADLWVHPTDQHPNEVVHSLAAETLAKALMSEERMRNALAGKE